jgi:CBS-domain-containing membrane protein
MTQSVRTCSPQDTLDVAARAMWEGDCGTVPVVDDSRRVVGMLTDRDICMAAYTQGKPLAAIPVASAMAKQVVSCRPDDELLIAERAMQKARVRRLPVVDAKGRLAGILSLNDLARNTGKDRAGKPRAISADEVTATLSAICEPGPGPGEAAAQPQPTPPARSERLLARNAPDGEC